MAIIDEAAHINETLLFSGIMPVTDQTNSCLIMISTPMDGDNYYSKLKDKRDDDGNLVFNTISVTHMCDNCRNRPVEEAVRCNHWEFLLPPRKSGRKEKGTLALYEGKYDELLRERFAIITGDARSIFPNKLVDQCIRAKNPEFVVTLAPYVIFVGADPGFHKSDLTFVAYGEFTEGVKVLFFYLFKRFFLVPPLPHCRL